MNHLFDRLKKVRLRQTRRQFLGRASTGIGSTALASLLTGACSSEDRATDKPASLTGDGKLSGVANPPHIIPRAKRIIYLYMAGGPSHLESFDYKPELVRMDGKPMPESFTQGQPIAQLQGKELRCMRPLYPFEKYGGSGQEICTLFPHTARIADDICIIRSMQTEQINHDPAHTFMNTGTSISGRPSMGSWIWYGLGSETENLPGFVVLASEGGGPGQPISARQWHSGFLPSRFQGVQFHSKGDPVLYISQPDGVSMRSQHDIVEAVQSLNTVLKDSVDDPEIATRISQYEMAFRMQTSVPDLMDLSDEPQYIKDMYGTQGADGSFAANCLLARRMAERGVRFIQLYHRGWDHHTRIREGMKTTSELVDRASAALVMDLKQRGMLEDTLVIWGGEFGRTPMAQGSERHPSQAGRDHHIRGFSIWAAGGGIQGGVTHGSTDALGYHSVEDPVHVHDLHATVLHLLGIHHKQLTYRFQGRDFRLTDVHGNVVRKILA